MCLLYRQCAGGGKDMFAYVFLPSEVKEQKGKTLYSLTCNTPGSPQ